MHLCPNILSYSTPVHQEALERFCLCTLGDSTDSCAHSFQLTFYCTDAVSFVEQYLADKVSSKQDPVQRDAVLLSFWKHDVIFAGFFFYSAKKVFIFLKRRVNTSVL